MVTAKDGYASNDSIETKDVSTAFLQSDPLPDGIIKYILNMGDDTETLNVEDDSNAEDGCASDDSMPSLLSGSDSDDDYWDRCAESEGDDECVIANALEAEGSDDSDFEVDKGVSVDIPEFKATTPGRTATATPPRFDAAALKPFEVMFADEKPYDTLQRGGHKTSFVLIDVASLAWFKVDEVSKTQHG